METFEAMSRSEHEQLVFCRDVRAGLRAVIGIHSTVLGPSLGGCRMRPYETEEEAVTDVLKLSKAMTYKAAVAGLNLGGGKAVIIGDPKTDKSEAMFRSLGRYVQGLNGRYIAAEDVGTTVEDMEYIYQETRFVTGVRAEHGGSEAPGGMTAYGIYMGLKACAREVFGSDSLDGRKVIIQGAGSVGSNLARRITDEGGLVVVADIDRDKLPSISGLPNVEIVDPESIYDVDADIFSPCALGGIINDATIKRLKVKVVAGGANNQLAKPEMAEKLTRKGILYAPDYVINAGGLINVATELEGYVEKKARAKTENIYDTLLRIFRESHESGITSVEASDRLAESRIETVAGIHRFYLHQPWSLYKRICP